MRSMVKGILILPIGALAVLRKRLSRPHWPRSR